MDDQTAIPNGNIVGYPYEFIEYSHQNPMVCDDLLIQ